MRPNPRNLRLRRFLAFAALLGLAACSGGGCGNCTVPAQFTPTPGPGGATPTPGPILTPAPGASPTPTPTPTPTPIPTSPALASCSQGAAAITLGPALAPFALLAGTTITNVGNTNVTFAAGATTGAFNDDLIGVSPGTAVTGFYPPGTDTDGPNAIYAAGYNTNAAVPLAAENALTTAYNNAAAAASTATVAGDLSQASVPGHPTGTLPPGVYTSSSTLSIAAGNLTLDGGGNAQGVFIFQIGSSLTTTLNGGTSGNVILTNGANACNVFWQVGSSATLGGAAFSGNVLANIAVTVNATTFNGRALARSSFVSIPVAGGSLVTNPGGN